MIAIEIENNHRTMKHDGGQSIISSINKYYFKSNINEDPYFQRCPRPYGLTEYGVDLFLIV